MSSATPTTPRSNGRPSEAAVAAARSLIGTALKQDGDAAREVATIPCEAWPSVLLRETARAIGELTVNGTALELPILFERMAALEISPSEIAEFTTAPPTCQPWTLATLLRDEYTERRERYFYELRAAGRITREELRHCLADLKTDGAAKPVAPMRDAVNLSAWLDSDPPRTEFLFEGIIPREALVMLTGRGGVGKSGVALALAVSAACGRPLLVSFVPMTGTRVLWLSSEDGPAEIWRRFARLRKTANLTDTEAQNFAANIRLYATPGWPLVDVNATPTEAYRWLSSEVQEWKPSLIIIDPLAHYNGTDENSNTLMAVFLSRLRDLSVPNGAVILVIHHTSKEREAEASSAAARGASAIRDAARCVLSLLPLTQKECEDFGITNPKLFAKIEQVKSSWTPMRERPIYLRNSQGVWLECDLERERAELHHVLLDRIARRLAEFLCDNPEDLTVRDVTREPRGKDLRQSLREEFGDNATRAAIEAALAYGEKAGILAIETSRNHGSPKRIPRQADNRTEADSERLSGESTL